MKLCRIVSYPSWERLQHEPEITGKFLQFKWQGIVYLLFATKSEHRFHNLMLARFLEDQGLPFRWEDEQTLVIETDAIDVIGGGRFHFDQGKKLLELWDNSQAYGRFDEVGLAACITATNHPFAHAQVVIR